MPNLFALPLLAALAGPSAPCTPQPLAASWKSLLETHPGIQAMDRRVEAREASVQEATSGFWPRLDATASYQVASETPRLSLEMPTPVPGMAPLKIERDMGDADRAEAGLEASWVVFSGGSTVHARRRELHSLEATRSSADQRRSALALQAALLDVALRAQMVDLRMAHLRRQARVRWRTTREAQARSGTATQVQVLQALAEEARATADTVQASGRLDSLQDEFRTLTGSEWTGPGSDSLVAAICPEPSEDFAPEDHREGALREQVLALRETEKSVGSTRYPVVAVAVGVKTGDPGMDQFSTGWNSWGYAGIQTRWNLFDGLSRRGTMHKLDAEARAVESESIEAHRDRDSRFRVLLSEGKRVEAEEAALGVAWEASLKAEKAIESAHRAGAATADDLLDASLGRISLESRLSAMHLRSVAISLQARFVSGRPFSFEGQP
ncbi:MAG: TolC family protein [Fibrobacteria bacterium]|nr:TolC family protein [Fibrobacteria bacterium]